MLKRTLEERFWSHVGPHDDSNKCWLWLGATIKSKKLRYGEFKVDGKNVGVHRFSYEMYHHAIIPEGMTIDHVKSRGCTSTLCVNPMHLEIVSGKVNILRGNGIPAMNARKTHCPRGHQFTKENIYLYHGKRHCRICKIDIQRQTRKRGSP